MPACETVCLCVSEGAECVWPWVTITECNAVRLKKGKYMSLYMCWECVWRCLHCRMFMRSVSDGAQVCVNVYSYVSGSD